MRNPSPSPTQPQRRRAFTLIEMLTAVTVLALVFLVVAFIIDAVRDTVNLGGAQDEVLSVAQVVETRMRSDIARLSHDGFMVLRAHRFELPVPGVDPDDLRRSYRMDQLGFFANGPWQSVLDPSIEASAAWIWYGHLRAPGAGFNDATSLGAPFDNAPPFLNIVNGSVDQNSVIPPHRWTLGRRATLVTPVIPPTPSSLGGTQHYTDSLWRNTDDDPNTVLPSLRGSDPEASFRFDAGTTDLAIGSLATYKDAIVNAFSNNATNGYLYLALATSRRTGQRDFNLPGILNNTNTAAQQSANVAATLAPYCSHFEIEYALDVADNATIAAGNYDITAGSGPDGAVDIRPRDTGDENPPYIIWHRLNPGPELRNPSPLNIGYATVGDIRAFAYDLQHDEVGGIRPDGQVYGNNDNLDSASGIFQIYGEGLERDVPTSGIYRAWPVLLRITMVLHDREGYLNQRAEETEEFIEAQGQGQRGRPRWTVSGEPDGQRLQLILRVPPRDAR
ncbi:PulJ/GspJ family protein [Mucisphaera sp.]|uniref:PulJ/GspJ family protein n=1 Tax=Mucisphaera sp. TaxID=2913024 RepID=UPI003D0C1527